MWPFFPQWKHSLVFVYWDLSLDFDLSLNVTRSLRHVFLLLPMFSMTKAWPSALSMHASLLWTSLLKIKSRMSSYLSLPFPTELLTAILMASQLFGKKAKTINARISSSNSISTEDNWFVIVLNLFRCFATAAPSAIFKLNNFFIRCTLLLADGFSYMLDKAVMKPTVVVSFTTLCATDIDRVNLITPSTCLSRRVHSASSILSGFFPKRGRCNFFP